MQHENEEAASPSSLIRSGPAHAIGSSSPPLGGSTIFTEEEAQELRTPPEWIFLRHPVAFRACKLAVSC
ncbi:hypothetical protein ASPZODRAFT_130672 [Penicilliopsis zonata CBS 506.65]|uniref:Uncharacterized protein n=1 Tax=Penicilliopsis zonata CBS 506.65 TaxID=1073090 RepID=A0A1L9SNG1_9EURO|nr:hypothetical protein ASPZODRAFT_130672 [Penicilliopsis zonata CBS 506.65]OJJ48594.1 hypothetical protein ASPZODRAFT_130672 [Penicilliopsis zonata CBS 506.65]